MSLQVVRRLAVNATAATLLAALTSLLHAQTTPPNNPPLAPRSILVFPQRDFVSTSGFEAGDLVTVEVVHANGQIASAATGVVPQDDTATPEFDGIVEVNHPGGACWQTVTPDIRPGDRVRTTRRNAAGAILGVDETTVANVTAKRPVQTAFDTVEIHGTAQHPNGAPIAITDLEQRLVAPGDAFDLNGRRTLRATSVAGDEDGTLSYDPVSPTNPAGIKWTAVYQGLNAADVARALDAESRIMWLGAGGGVESTIYEIGAGIVAGPSAPCAAPLEVLPPPPGSELVAPSTPTNVIASIVGTNTVSLSWTASTDNVGVTSYGVYRNGVAIANVANQDGTAPAPAVYQDFNVPPGTYTYTVDAADEVGNRSAKAATAPELVTTTQQVAADLPRCTGTPTNACVSEPPGALPEQVQIIPFPARDFTSASGYTEADASVTVQVIRNGFLISTANVIPVDDPSTAAFDGIVEVNHPGGGCWVGATPDIRAGDVVRHIAYLADGTVRRIDQTRVANISVARPQVVRAASAGANDGILQVHGTAMDANGAPLPLDQINQRLVATRDRFDVNGRRTLRAGLGEEYELSYDTVDNPDGIKFTATYTGLGANDVARAVGGVSPSTGINFPGADSRILWLDNPTLVAPGLTIYENSDATASGPSGGFCSTPLEPIDTNAPSTPVPTAAQEGANSVRLTWSPSSDDTYVNGYGIYRRNDDVAGADFVRIRNVGATLPPGATTLSFVDENVPAGNHNYAVDAVDSASPLKVNHPAAFAGPNTSDPILQGVEWGNRSALGIANALRQDDVLAPSVPINLVGRVRGAGVDLTWSPSTDDVGVTTYHVYRNGSKIADVNGAPPVATFSDPVTVAHSTTFTYTVDAADAARNRSAQSAPATVVVTPVADTTAPSQPTALAADTRDLYSSASAPALGPRDVKLSWTAATDTIGVTGYGIYRRPAASLGAASAFTKIADLNGTTLTYTDLDLAVGTYDYTVDAIDSAGNRSLPAAAAVDIVTVDDPPAGSHSIISFPQRDFVSSTGYAVGEGPVIVSVIRNGKVWARSTPVPVAEDSATPGLGVVEVNHPGGGCWSPEKLNGLDGITPDLRAGDIVRLTNRFGVADQTTTANVYGSRVTDRYPDGTPLPPGTIQTHGSAQDAFGNPLPVDAIESRLISNSANPFSVNGRRTLRSGGDGTLAYDPIGATNPRGVNWTATFSGLSQSDVELAKVSEVRAVWLGRNPLALNEITFFENADDIVGGPSAPECTAPAEAGAAVAFEEAAPFVASFDPFAQAIAFGSRGTGTSTTQTLVLTNVGAADAARAIGGTLSIAAAGLDVGGDFEITANSCTAAVAIGDSCSVAVKFSPTAIGLRTATLRFSTNAVNSPVLAVALSGDASDASAPAVTAPLQTFAVGARVNPASNSVPVAVTSTATDPSGVASMQLEQSTDAGKTWVAVAPAPSVAASGSTAQLTAALDLRLTSTYQFRAQAVDSAVPANSSAPVAAPTYRLSLVDDNTAAGKGVPAPIYQGSWSTDKAAVGALGNTVHFATAPAAGKANTVSIAFAGAEVAFVSTRGPDRGRVTISVDGGAVQTIDLYAPTRQQATIVATQAGLGAGTHTATISVLTTRNAASSGTRVDVDAFVLKF